MVKRYFDLIKTSFLKDWLRKVFQTFQKLFRCRGNPFLLTGGTLFEKSVPPTTPSQKLFFSEPFSKKGSALSKTSPPTPSRSIPKNAGEVKPFFPLTSREKFPKFLAIFPEISLTKGEVP
ncbi:MAG: hypothetical protein D6805_06080, partial [Planctomycetota bacterium]